MHRKDDTNRLEVELFGKIISSPLILGSGTLVERFEQIAPFVIAGAGAIIPRSTRHILERTNHPIPHLYQAGTKRFPIMLNAEWTGAEIDYWEPYLEVMAHSKKIIPSISGRDIDGCITACKKLEHYAGNWLYLEINLSCAHSNNVHGMITRNESHIKEILTRLKDNGIQTPIAIKLGHSDQIINLANIAKEAGADAIVALNTFGPVFDFTIDDDGQPRPIVGIQGGKGGLSGAPLFQIALTDIAEICRQVEIPVIGCGGVTSGEDVIKMLMAGACAVEVYTAAHVRGNKAPTYFTDTNKALLEYMDKHSIPDLKRIIGKALPILDQETTLAVRVPEVVAEDCIGCDLCIPICLPDAISVLKAGNNKAGHIVAIDERKCIGCGHCLHVCPTHPKALIM